MIKRILWINKCEILVKEDRIYVCYLKKKYRDTKQHIIPLKFIFAPFTDGSHARTYINILDSFVVPYNDIVICDFKKNINLKNITGKNDDLIIITKNKKHIISYEQFSKKDLLIVKEILNKKIKM